MDTPVMIRPMRPEDLEFAADLTLAEGWQGETILELAGAYHFSAHACFIAELDGAPAGMCMGVAYDRYAFLGGLIVLPEARGRGLGEQLLMQTVRALQSKGANSVFLDGVVPAVPLYERCGFQKVCRSLRFRGRLPGAAHPHVHPMTADHLDAVCRLDQQAFGADRGHFLALRLKHYPSLCKVALMDGQLEGYIMGRYGHTVLAAGPWIASPRLERPQDLLDALAQEDPLLPLSIGCLADNTRATQTLQASSFSMKADSPWRMVFGDLIQPGDVRLNWAVGSPAKG